MNKIWSLIKYFIPVSNMFTLFFVSLLYNRNQYVCFSEQHCQTIYHHITLMKRKLHYPLVYMILILLKSLSVKYFFFFHYYIVHVLCYCSFCPISNPSHEEEVLVYPIALLPPSFQQIREHQRKPSKYIILNDMDKSTEYKRSLILSSNIFSSY